MIHRTGRGDGAVGLRRAGCGRCMRIRSPQGMFWVDASSMRVDPATSGSLRMNAIASHRSTRGWKADRAWAPYSVAAGAMLSAPATWAANAADLSVALDVKPADDVVPPAPQTYSVSVSRAGLRLLHLLPADLSQQQHKYGQPGRVQGDGDGHGRRLGDRRVQGPCRPDAAASPNCPAPPAPNATQTNTVTCAIGQLKAGDKRDFFLLFRAPEAGATVAFTGDTTFSSGNSPNSPRPPSPSR